MSDSLVEPRIQYTRTADGLSIASWTLGEGKPLVYLAGGPWSHIELWEVPECRQWYERLARGRMLVRYDMRGTGLSERSGSDFSLDALVLDVEAVVDRLGSERFALLGAADAGPVAVAYAARHSQRVSRLVLWCSWARTADIDSPRIRAWRGLIDQDWELMTETCAHIVLGWSGGEVGRHAAQRLRESVTPEVARAALDALRTFDVTHLLPEVKAPTLVIHRQRISWFPAGVARGLASGIRGARLVLLEGESSAPYLGDTEAAARVIDEFLDDGEAIAGRKGSQIGGLHAAGRESFVEEAAGDPRRRARPDANGLTEREVEVLRLLAGGKTNKEIAGELVLSVRTVERHISNIYDKIHARGRADATAYALTHGIV